MSRKASAKAAPAVDDEDGWEIVGPQYKSQRRKPKANNEFKRIHQDDKDDAEARQPSPSSQTPPAQSNEQGKAELVQPAAAPIVAVKLPEQIATAPNPRQQAPQQPAPLQQQPAIKTAPDVKEPALLSSRIFSFFLVAFQVFVTLDLLVPRIVILFGGTGSNNTMEINSNDTDTAVFNTSDDTVSHINITISTSTAAHESTLGSLFLPTNSLPGTLLRFLLSWYFTETSEIVDPRIAAVLLLIAGAVVTTATVNLLRRLGLIQGGRVVLQILLVTVCVQEAHYAASVAAVHYIFATVLFMVGVGIFEDMVNVEIPKLIGFKFPILQQRLRLAAVVFEHLLFNIVALELAISYLNLQQPSLIDSLLSWLFYILALITLMRFGGCFIATCKDLNALRIVWTVQPYVWLNLIFWAYRIYFHATGEYVESDDIVITVIVTHYLVFTIVHQLKTSPPVDLNIVSFLIVNPYIWSSFFIAWTMNVRSLKNLILIELLMSLLASHVAKLGAKLWLPTSNRQYLRFSAYLIIWCRVLFYIITTHRMLSAGYLRFFYDSFFLIAGLIFLAIFVNSIIVNVDAQAYTKIQRFVSGHQRTLTCLVASMIGVCLVVWSLKSSIWVQILADFCASQLGLFVLDSATNTIRPRVVSDMFDWLWRVEVFVYGKIKHLLVLCMIYFRPLVTIAVAHTFIDAFLGEPALNLAVMGYVLAAWSSIVLSIKLTADLVHSERLHGVAAVLYRNLDFGLMPVVSIVGKLIIKLLKQVTVLRKVFGVLYQLVKAVFNLLNALLFKPIISASRFVRAHPTACSAALAVTMAAYLQFQKTGVFFEVPSPHDLSEVATRCGEQLENAVINTAGFVYSLAPSLIDNSVAVLAWCATELVLWWGIMIDTTIPSYHLLKSVSFAWLFYCINVAVGRLGINQILNFKTLVVPCFALYLTAQLAPELMLFIVIVLMIWTPIKVLRDLRALNDQRLAAEQLELLRQQGQLRPITLVESVPPKIFETGHCLICYESFDATTVPATPMRRESAFTFEELSTMAQQKEMFTTFCGHQYHKGCLSEWTKISRSDRCPLCTQHMNPSDVSLAMRAIF